MPGDTTQKPGPGAHSPERVSLSQLMKTGMATVLPSISILCLIMSAAARTER